MSVWVVHFKITWFGHCSLHFCWMKADNGCGRNNCGSSSLSLQLFTFSPLLLCTLNFPPRFFLPLSPPSRQALLCLGDLYSRSINLKERERCGDMTVYGGLAWCLLWCHQNREHDIVCCHVNQRDSCSCRDRHKWDGGMCNCYVFHAKQTWTFRNSVSLMRLKTVFTTRCQSSGCRWMHKGDTTWGTQLHLLKDWNWITDLWFGLMKQAVIHISDTITPQ